MLKGDKLTEALQCISEVPKSKELVDPTYEEHVENLEGVVNGFYKCLLEQYITDVVEDGYCGPGTYRSESTDVDITLVCAKSLCCGKGTMDGAGPEAAVYSC
jgi:hypothetical protein